MQPPHPPAYLPSLPRVLVAVGCAVLVTTAAWVAGRIDPVAPDAARAVAGQVESGRAFAWLERFQADFAGRRPATPAHAAAPEFIASALRDAGAQDVRIERPRSLHPAMNEPANVLARVPGTDRSRAIVLGAHHDTVARAPGAIDDGGAIAVLVEVARALVAHVNEGGEPPACDIEFAVFDGEEFGDVGSKAHVTSLGPDGRRRVRAAVVLELVGWKRDTLVAHTVPYGFAWDAEGITPAWIVERIAVAGSLTGIEVGTGDPVLGPWYQSSVRLLKFQTGSDAGAFLEQGVPSCMLAGSALTNFYAHYHRPTDSMAQVSSERLDDAARVTAAAAIELAALSDEHSPRGLGTAYLRLGLTTIGHLGLAGIALFAALPLFLAARAHREIESATSAKCLLALGATVAALGAVGSVVGVLCGAPLALGVAIASMLRRWSRVPLYVGALPTLVQILVLVAGSAMFGFAWRAPWVETLLLAGLFLASCACFVLAVPAPQSLAGNSP